MQRAATFKVLLDVGIGDRRLLGWDFMRHVDIRMSGGVVLSIAPHKSDMLD